MCMLVHALVAPSVQAQGNIERVGDVLQLAIPAAAYGMTFAHDGRQERAQFRQSLLTTMLLTHALKRAVPDTRPNGGPHSYVSGHTSAAFWGASFIQRQYGWRYGVPAYMAASFVGWSRIKAQRHFFDDVVRGATVGVAGNRYLTRLYDRDIHLTPTADHGTYGLNLNFLFPRLPIDRLTSVLSRSSVPMIGGDIWHIVSSPFKISRSDAIRLTSLAVLGVGSIVWFDDEADEEFAREGHNVYLKPAKGLVRIGEAYDRIGTRRAAAGLSGAMLAGGLILRDKKLLETTRLMIESVIISGAITYWGKGLIGRSRPYADRGARDFNLLKFSKIHEFRALPSGHATSVFSMMTVIAKQYDRWWVEIPAYTLAASVALQRMDSRMHWTSDVLVGGAIGYWIANALVDRHKRRSQETSISPHISGDRVGVNIRF